MVAPTRGRGSKHPGRTGAGDPRRSPPPGGADRNAKGGIVTRPTTCRPHPGARIETVSKMRARSPSAGRPHPGARIETGRRIAPRRIPHVAPTRGRGSKHVMQRHRHRPFRRPHPGARIETLYKQRPTARVAVAPTRGRGSKLVNGADPGDHRSSPPPGGADRNAYGFARAAVRSGRPHPGARIETDPPRGERQAKGVAPTRGRGSKPSQSDTPDLGHASPPPGGADRNRNPYGIALNNAGRPHPGARIETRKGWNKSARTIVAPTRGRGSKRYDWTALNTDTVSPPPGGADRNYPEHIEQLRRESRPHPGARIETYAESGTYTRFSSPPPGGADRNVEVKK